MTVSDQVGAAPKTKTPTGRWVVLGMFGFAITVTSTLYIYWHLHTAEFRPLQEALGREFKGSNPLVQGGQEKMHKGTPRLLRIILRIDFDPNDKTNQEKVDRRVDRIQQIAGEHQDLTTYDKLVVHLVWRRPEQTTVNRTITRKLSGGDDPSVHSPERASSASRDK